jgi:hypothetical protein
MRARVLTALGAAALLGGCTADHSTHVLGVHVNAWVTVAAIGQAVGGLMAVIAAFFAFRAIRATHEAAEAQTRGAAIQDLLARYAAAETYAALEGFGRFVRDVLGEARRTELRDSLAVAGDADAVRARYRILARAAVELAAVAARPAGADKGAAALADLLLGLPDAGAPGGAAARGQQGVAMDTSATAPAAARSRGVGADRRLVHHHFRLVWSLSRAGSLPDDHLWIVTRAHHGYALWLDAALPLTLALAERDGRGLPAAMSGDWDVEWPWDLIARVRRMPGPLPAADPRSD